VAASLRVGEWRDLPPPGPPHMLSPARIEHLDLAVGSYLDIGWFEIPVDDAFLIRGLQGFPDLEGELQGLVDRDRTLFQTLRQRLPFDQLQDEKVFSPGVLEPVDGRNIGVIKDARNFCLPLEAGNPSASMANSSGRI